MARTVVVVMLIFTVLFSFGYRRLSLRVHWKLLFVRSGKVAGKNNCYLTSDISITGREVERGGEREGDREQEEKMAPR